MTQDERIGEYQAEVDALLGEIVALQNAEQPVPAELLRAYDQAQRYLEQEIDSRPSATSPWSKWA